MIIVMMSSMNVALEDLKLVFGASNKLIYLRIYLNIIKRIKWKSKQEDINNNNVSFVKNQMV